MEYIALLVMIAAIVGIFKPYIPKAKRWHFGIAAFLSFISIGIIAPAPQADPNSNSEEGFKTGETNTASEAQPASKWSYSEQKDEMRGTVTKFAHLDGENAIKLDFPYGEQKGLIQIQQSGKNGLDVLVGVKSGQIMCNTYQATHVSVKFDEGPIQRIRCTDASDGTSNLVFLSNPKAFLSKLKSSKKLVVEAEFFQNGNQQLVFDTSGLKWD